MVDLQALTCPQCASTRVRRAADGTFRCQNCSTRLLLVDQLGELVVPDVAGWLDCPKCGAVNDAEHFFCSQCGTEIRYQCPVCSTMRLASEPVCGICGHTLQSAQLLAQQKKWRKRRRNRSLITGGIVTVFMLALWMIIVVSFDWKNDHTVDTISNITCCMSPFGGLAAGAIAYWLQSSSDPTAGR